MAELSSSSHRFRWLGRGAHPVMDSAEALAALPGLDDTYWVATAAPVAGLRGDARFHALLDADGDGRIRSDDLRAAVRWLFAHLDAPEAVTAGAETVAPGSLRADGPEHGALAKACRRVAPEGGEVALPAVRAALAEEEARGLSAAGKVLPAAVTDPDVADLVATALRARGGVDHPSGAKAVDAETLEGFLADAAAWVAWRERGATDAVAPLGREGTAAAVAAVDVVADRVDAFFVLCDALALDPSLAKGMSTEVAAAELLDPERAREVLERAPLAPPRADGVLSLDDALNPAWRDAVHGLFREAVRPLLDGDRRTLDRAAWLALRGRLDAWRGWRAEQPALGGRGFDLDAVRAHLAAPERAQAVRALLEASVEGAVTLGNLQALERLLLYQAHLLRLANNFVAMPDLLAPDARGLMERGRLVMDGRSFDLSIRVTDAARAERFGAMSPIFVMYVKVGDKGGDWTEEVAVPVTAGDRGHLVEGQWGVFFPLEGGVKHAQVRAIASSPISIREALWVPFKRISTAVEAAADKAANAQKEALDAKLVSAVDSTAAATTSLPTAPAAPAAPVAGASATAPPSSPPPWTQQVPLMLAGGGIAFAAVASSLTYIVDVAWSAATGLAAALVGTALVASSPASVQAVVGAVALPVSLLLLLVAAVAVPFVLYALPVAFATWLRLRQRDLGALLEGAGWAVNERLMLARRDALRLTRRAEVAPSDWVR